MSGSKTIYAHWALTDVRVLKNVALTYNLVSGRIIEMAENVQLPQALNGKNLLLAPGLLNGHCHLELLTPEPVPLLEGEGMADWANKIIKINITGTEDTRKDACEKNVEELFSTGCTFVNDISTTGTSAQVMVDKGIRGKVCLEYFHPQHIVTDDSTTPIINRYLDFSHRFKDNPKIQIALSPHAPYNVSTTAMQHVIETLKPDWIHTHVAESFDEEDWFTHKRPNGIDQVHEKYFGAIFGPQYPEKRHLDHITPALKTTNSWQPQPTWVMAHGCFLNNEELNTFAELGATLAHCPISNDVLKHKPLNLKNVLAHNVQICIGTDSRTSNPQLDLRAEARVTIERGLDKQTAFQLLTNLGAKALYQNDLGQLQAGFAADFGIWEINDSAILEDLYTQFFKPQTVLSELFIAGQRVYQNQVIAKQKAPL